MNRMTDLVGTVKVNCWGWPLTVVQSSMVPMMMGDPRSCCDVVVAMLLHWDARVVVRNRSDGLNRNVHAIVAS